MLRLACGGEPGPYVEQVIAVGFPTAYRDKSNLDGCRIPRVFVQSTHDQYGPVAELQPLVESLPEPKRLVLIEAEDHFFAGALERLEDEIAALPG